MQRISLLVLSNYLLRAGYWMVVVVEEEEEEEESK